MGRLNPEIEAKIREFYTNRGGLLIAICEEPDSTVTSSRATRFCDACDKCSAISPVISLGEIDSQLKGMGLFAVGLMDDKVPDTCPICLDVNRNRTLTLVFR